MNRQLVAFIKTFFYIKSVFFLLLIFSIASASAQPGTEKGLPFITNYTTKMYNSGAQNWSIEQDNNGIMYFANSGNTGRSTAMSYDGVKWNQILNSGFGTGVNTRCLVKDKDGIIYYGNVGDFGYLGHDSLGQTKAYSLIKYIQKDKRNFFDIWSAQITDKGIYFQSRERLFRLTKTGTGSNQQWISKSWEPATHFMYTFYLDGILYIHESGIGLLKMINDSLVLIPGSEFLGKDRVQIMLPYSESSASKNSGSPKQYLFGAMGGNLYIFDGKNFRPFKTEADSILKLSLLYKGILLNGNYALATTGKGLIIINAEGKIQQVINRTSGLQSETIYSIFLDDAGSLWLGLDNGISKININSPFTKFGVQSGINSGILSMARLPDGSLYLGTNNGLLKYNPSSLKFEINEQVAKNQVFNLLVDGNSLLIATDGLYLIKNNKTFLVQPSVAGNLKITSLFISKKYPDILYAGTSFGISLFSRVPNKPSGWEFLGDIPIIKEGIWSFAEKKDGQMWAGTQSGETYLVTLAPDENGNPVLSKTTVEVFGKKEGFKIPFNGVFTLNHNIYFGSDSATYTFNEKQKQFVKTSFNGLINYAGIEDSTGKIWLVAGTTDNFRPVIATPQSNGSYQLDSTSLLPIIDIASNSNVYSDIHGITWFLSTDGLFRYDQKIKPNTDLTYNTLISNITAEKQKLNPEIAGNGPPKIKFNDNSLRFEYAAPFYEQEDKIEYQTWLEGFEKTWSDWGKNTYKEYTNLAAGKYVFHVRAKNLYHKISEEAVYSFTIMAPWYSTWWAYFLYALIFLLAGFLILKWRTRELEAKHRELEKTIKERTGQLSARVEELALINNVQEGLVSKMDMQSIYDLVGNKIRDAFDAQAVIIGSFDNETTEHFNYVIENQKRFYPDSRPIDKLRKQLIQTKQKIVIKNKEESLKWFGNKAIKDTKPVKSAVFVPLITGDKVKRYVSLQNVDKENAFSDSDIRLLETLANSMSVALENARLFDETARLLKETEQRNAEFAIITSVQEGLASKLDIQAIYDLVGNKVQSIFDAQVVDIVTYNSGDDLIYPRYVIERGVRFYEDPRPLIGLRKHVVETGQPFLINKDNEKISAQYGNPLVVMGEVPKSVLFVPMIVGREVKGIISLQNLDHEDAFSDSDLRLLQTLSNSMSVALENARLFDETSRLLKETEQRTSELAVINSVQEGLVAQMDIQSIYDLVGEKIRNIFSAQIIDIVTYNKKKNLIEDRYAFEKGDRTLLGAREPLGFRKHVIETRQVFVVNEDMDRKSKEYDSYVTIGEQPKSAVFVPMITGGEVTGVISLQNLDHENAFSDSSINLLTTLANS
ncbi:MAG TPA: GAF domain-containing protein, partial [Hanamia sp.]|nr:GAF domain-containing protein [Hanamia sp.]